MHRKEAYPGISRHRAAVREEWFFGQWQDSDGVPAKYSCAVRAPILLVNLCKIAKNIGGIRKSTEKLPENLLHSAVP